MKTYIRFGEIPTNQKSINYFTKNNENGVSVFDGNLSLINLRQINRIGTKAYIVTGDEVGIGNDGEPLLSNVKIIEEYKYLNEYLSDYIYNVMMKSFNVYIGERDSTNYFFGRFFKETKICEKCGNVIEWYESCCDEGYTKKDTWLEHVFNGVTFKEPKQGFDCDLGVRR